MKTEILNISPEKPEMSRIEMAVLILRDGGLITFPNERTYRLIFITDLYL